jgi:hypothetical protein
MANAFPAPDYHYVAYVDESGDSGIKRVKPIDKPGSSEWLVVAGVLIREENEQHVPNWIRHALWALNDPQLKDIHFAKLNRQRQMIMCEQIVSHPLRIFVVASNKKNMRGYRNINAEKTPSQNWFYCWMTRVLLERMTSFVAAHSREHHGSVKYMKVEFSENGGLRYGQMKAYYEWIREKSRAGNMFLTMGDIEYETLHSLLLEVHPHSARAGLKLADAAAAAFYQACDNIESGPCFPSLAMKLKDRMARVPDALTGRVAGYGVKLLPSLRKAKLTSDQEKIFRYYGYPHQWWAPASSAPRPF